MRRVIYAYALLAFAFAPSAFADDLSWITGTQPAAPMNVNGWAGIYLGGQVSYSGAGGNFDNTTQGPVAFALRNTTLEEGGSCPPTGRCSVKPITAPRGSAVSPATTPNSKGWCWASRPTTTRPTSRSSRRIRRSRRKTSAGGNAYDVTISGSGSVTDLNFGTLRARAGWALGPALRLCRRRGRARQRQHCGDRFGDRKSHKISRVPLWVPRRRRACRSRLPAPPARAANGWWASPSAAASTSRSRNASARRIRICAVRAGREPGRGRSTASAAASA